MTGPLVQFNSIIASEKDDVFKLLTSLKRPRGNN